MGSISLKFPIVIYKSEDSDARQFTAHCLNLDLVADDDTVEGAVAALLETIESQIEAAEKYGAQMYKEAPKKYWEMLANGQELPRELRERIAFNANRRRRLGRSRRPTIDIESQCEPLRQLQPA